MDSIFTWVPKLKTTEAPALRRELKARHLTMIAIGGSIGTGLFVASGATILRRARRRAVLYRFRFDGSSTSLGERLAAYMPVIWLWVCDAGGPNCGRRLWFPRWLEPLVQLGGDHR